MKSAANPQKSQYDTYKTLMDECLTNIISQTTNKELIAACKHAQEQVKADINQQSLSANQYFHLFKAAIELRNPALIELLLYKIQKLFSHGFLDGNCEDVSLETQEESSEEPPRLLIDLIVETICKCADEHGDQVQLEVIKTLLSITIAANSKVHGLALRYAINTQYRIHLFTNSTVNRNTAKAALTQMVNVVFAKMDTYLRNGNHESLYTDWDDRENQEDEKEESEEQKAAREKYIGEVTRLMVDNVCLHDARTQAINEFTEQDGLETEATSEPSVSKSSSQEKRVKLNPIPAGENEYPDVDLKNEKGIQVGRYGWCVVCRETADLYCTDTFHPVCSEKCQRKHSIEVNAIEKAHNRSQPLSAEGCLALDDAIFVFKHIVKMSVDGENQNERDTSHYVIRKQIVGLEMVLAILEKPKKSFLTNKKFVGIIKNALCDGLLKYSVSDERNIFNLVVSIFYHLFLHFRQHLKNVILAFIETIFLKLLDSGNASFHHKHTILIIFDKISQDSMMLLDIFVNYDMQIGQKDISKHIVESLFKIATGKFGKAAHKGLITEQEEQVLRKYSLQIMCQMLGSFSHTIDSELARNLEAKVVYQQASSQVKGVASSEPRLSELPADQDLEPQSVATSQTKKLRGSPKHEQFEKLQSQRARKILINDAAAKFIMKPKNGIAFLTKNKLVPDPEQDYEAHVKAIVHFLKTTPTLDKTVIGEFIGVNNKLNKDVLAEFIDQYDMKDKEFITSLKTVLQGFRLPGEGQIVDRIMERFGEKFVADNPEGTDGCQPEMSAECVYLLSYATMMMQTSLHNPNAVKTPMDVVAFGNMIKGINSGENLKQEFIQKIFDEVKHNPFTLNEDEDARIKQETEAATSYYSKRELFKKEGIGLVQRGKSQIASSKTDSTFISVSDTNLIKDLFENIWDINMATFLLILEETTNPKVAATCIDGFAHAIKICGYFEMSSERSHFVQSFVRFAFISDQKEIKDKNIQVIHKILELATQHGNFLGDSWQYILQEVSRLEEMINLGKGQRDSDFFDPTSQPQPRQKEQPSQPEELPMDLKSVRERTYQQNSELISQNFSLTQLDAIFMNSINLDQTSISCFIENLCKVSRVELSDPRNPRKFSLQAIVEVADLNMARIRFVWSQIWQMLSEHFVWVGSHENNLVAIYSVDSLRQLADKFLIKEEFASFNFQKDFLKPFERIILNNIHTRPEITAFIVMGMTQICAMKTAYIKSGWSVIIGVFTLAAQDSDQHLVQQSFQALKTAVTTHFDLLETNFVELVNCLNKYSANHNFLNNQAAQVLLEVCAKRLKDHPGIVNHFISKQGTFFHQRDIEQMRDQSPQYGLKASLDQKPVEESPQPDASQIRLSVLKGLWFPILQNLTKLVKDSREKGQKVFSLEVFFQVLGHCTEQLEVAFWKEMLSQVLLPMLQDIDIALRIPDEENEEAETELYQEVEIEQHLSTIQLIVRGFNTFFSSYHGKLATIIPHYIDTLALFTQELESVAILQRVLSSLQEFIVEVSPKLTSECWTEIILIFSAWFEQNRIIRLDQELDEFFCAKDEEKDDSQLVLSLAKTSVQLCLMTIYNNSLESAYKSWSSADIMKILSSLDETARQTSELTSKFELCIKLQRADQHAGLQLFSNIMNLERTCLATTLQIRFNMLAKTADEETDTNQDILFKLCTTVLTEYTGKAKNLQTIKAEQQKIVGPSHSLADINEAQLDQKTQKDLKPLWIQENILVKRVQSLSPIVRETILANIQALPITQLKTQAKSLGPILLELMLCDDFEIRSQNKVVLDKILTLGQDEGKSEEKV